MEFILILFPKDIEHRIGKQKSTISDYLYMSNLENFHVQIHFVLEMHHLVFVDARKCAGNVLLLLPSVTMPVVDPWFPIGADNLGGGGANSQHGCVS